MMLPVRTAPRPPARARHLLLAALALVTTLSACVPLPPSSGPSNPFAGRDAWTGLNDEYLDQARAWAATRPADAGIMLRMAATPKAVWLGEWYDDPTAAVKTYRRRAAAEDGAIPIFVVYDIPHRDCGGFSAGGAASAAEYRAYIDKVAVGLRGGTSVAILEPDALAGIDCLTAQQRDERMALLRYAVKTLSGAGAKVYVDAGNATWHPVSVMARRLKKVQVGKARGFSLNVANYHSVSDNLRYGDVIARQLGSHYVVDTSRNGTGDHDEWCNDRRAAVGPQFTTATGSQYADAFIWVISPGGSDGPCHGGPEAGIFWPAYALELAHHAGW